MLLYLIQTLVRVQLVTHLQPTCRYVGIVGMHVCVKLQKYVMKFYANFQIGYLSI